MSDYRRYFVPGATYFFTVVSDHRRRFLTTELARNCLREAILAEQNKRPFTQVAMVLLPDHFHAIWALPSGDADYSQRISSIKQAFTRSYLSLGGQEGAVSDSRSAKRERAIWQRRFWEHLCRDEDDIKTLADYIHWNPCKHGLVRHVKDYPWSTFHKFVRKGEYEPNWGNLDPCPGWSAPEWE